PPPCGARPGRGVLRPGSILRPAPGAGRRQRLHADMVYHRSLRRADGPQGTAFGMASCLLVRPGGMLGIVRIAASLEPLDRRWCARTTCGHPLARVSLPIVIKTGAFRSRLAGRFRRGRPMKLDEILQGNDAFVFMERYVDETAKTYSPFAGKSEVAPEYQP